jgi:hypothetical protein
LLTRTSRCLVIAVFVAIAVARWALGGDVSDLGALARGGR